MITRQIRTGEYPAGGVGESYPPSGMRAGGLQCAMRLIRFPDVSEVNRCGRQSGALWSKDGAAAVSLTHCRSSWLRNDCKCWYGCRALGLAACPARG